MGLEVYFDLELHQMDVKMMFISVCKFSSRKGSPFPRGKVDDQEREEGCHPQSPSRWCVDIKYLHLLLSLSYC